MKKLEPLKTPDYRSLLIKAIERLAATGHQFEDIRKEAGL